jgi:DNA-binding MarR family transcriptional regulator
MKELVGLLPRVIRGLKRHKDPAAVELWRSAQLGQRHASALYLLTDQPKTVGELAADLELGLATVSGVVAELDRAGLVERQQDPADRRRTIVTIRDEHRPAIQAWLNGAAAPIVRVLERLSPEERAVFVRAMDLLDQELAAREPVVEP